MSQRTIVTVFCAGGLTLVLGYLVSNASAGSPQVATAIVLTLIYLVATLIRPSIGLVTIALTIPFLGMLRRLLYQQSPTQFDSLVLVIPAYTLLMVLIISVSYRDRLQAVIRESLTARLLLLFIGICILEVVNPLQGGLSVGAAGAIFYIIPLCWFFIGRVFLTEELVQGLLLATLCASVLSSFYGLLETFVGFTGFDHYWIQTAGYAALYVGAGTVRALGPTTSTAEYSTLLGIGLVILLSLAIFRGRKLTLLLGIPLFAALILESTRLVVITTVAGLLVLIVLRQRSRAVSMVTLVILLLGIAYLYVTNGQTVYTSGSASPLDTLLSHEVNGLLHPFNSQYSTGQSHITAIVTSFSAAVRNPIGQGLGATSIAASKFGTTSQSSEFDIANAFIATGLLGGLLYAVILFRTCKAAITLTFRHKRFLDAAALGILIVDIGQILNGGYYSLMPLIWLLIAWIDIRYCQQGHSIAQQPTPAATVAGPTYAASSLTFDRV